MNTSTTNSSTTITYGANNYGYNEWNKWKNVWVFTANEQNCDGQICPDKTFCMRPAVSMNPMHCVHADFVYNVVGALKLGNKDWVEHHEQIVPLLNALALYLIFLALLAHLFVLGVRLRQLSHCAAFANDVPTYGGAKGLLDGGKANVPCVGAGGVTTENGYEQTEFINNTNCNTISTSTTKYLAAGLHHQQQCQSGAGGGGAGGGRTWPLAFGPIPGEIPPSCGGIGTGYDAMPTSRTMFSH